jgi:hypothetical protein
MTRAYTGSTQRAHAGPARRARHSDAQASNYYYTCFTAPYVSRVRSWQRSKASASASYEVVTQPRLAYGKGDDGQWHLNGLAHGDNGPYSPSSAPFITLSTYTLKGASGAPFCLDAGAGTPGIVIVFIHRL